MKQLYHSMITGNEYKNTTILRIHFELVHDYPFQRIYSFAHIHGMLAIIVFQIIGQSKYLLPHIVQQP